MRITIGSLGQRGDSDASIAIGLALRDRGHVVTFVSSADGANDIAQWDFAVRVVSADMREFLRTAAVTRALKAGGTAAFVRCFAEYIHAARHTLRANLLAACADADAIVLPAALLPESLVLGELLRKPVCVVATAPLLPPSAQFAHPLIATRSYPVSQLNALSHAAFDRAFSRGTRLRDDAEWRALLGLQRPPNRFVREALRRQIPQIHVYSSRLFPRPADWPAFVHTTGRIAISPARRFAAGHGRLPADLVGWLDAGPPPVAIAFSRLPVGEPCAQLALAGGVAQALGVRTVVTGLDPASCAAAPIANVFVAGDVDHAQLFPRCRSAVHHGGSWTTATAARAGIPAVACSIAGDQHLWGRRLRQLGIGEHQRFADVNAARLAAALKRLERSGVRQRARDLGAQIHAEDGLPVAIDLIERLAHGAQTVSLAGDSSARPRTR